MSLPFFNRFPYTNLNDINLDWIIKKVKELAEQFSGQAADISYAVLTANHASSTATSARNAAQIAQNDAINALERANSVQGIANNALTTAQSAVNTAAAAESTANAIAGTANNALSVAQAAEATAAAAEQAAQAAVESAQAANTTAGTAVATANNAAQSAQTAINTASSALSIATSSGGLNFTDVASGQIAHFPDGIVAQPLSLEITINPAQSGSGAPSGENIRAISGYNKSEIIVSPTESAADGITYQIPFGEIIYGGTLDVINGVLISNREYRRGLGSDFRTSGGYRVLRTTFTSARYSTFIPPVSNMFTWLESGQFSAPWQVRLGSAGVLFWSFPTTYTDEDILAISPNVEYCIYIRADYQETFNVSKPEIMLLNGTNNVWNTNNGETTVEYRADAQKWIEKKIAEVEAIALEN